ncbi:MAG: transporter [Actinomycetia bacterium]|nr:transporter [Actinomycetes bacterium]MCH9710466.1 transporter [Actinomycetes bacterium]MCH9767260.1 transporter [Actinomycetes bacterium]
MNTATLVASLIMAGLVALTIAVLTKAMIRGWRRRAERQADIVGTLPSLPDTVGAAIVSATEGLYVGSTLASRWNERVAARDLGFRAKAVLSRYPEGIMLQRQGAGPIWIPDDAIIEIRTEKYLAGKVILGGQRGDREGGAPSHGGILAIRWRLPTGAEIDTGFRADDRRAYSKWLPEEGV